MIVQHGFVFKKFQCSRAYYALHVFNPMFPAPLECEDLDEDPYIQFEVIEVGEDPNSTYSAGTSLKVSCTVGYGVNLPNATVKCVHGNWKPIPPQCDAREYHICTIPIHEANAKGGRGDLN